MKMRSSLTFTGALLGAGALLIPMTSATSSPTPPPGELGGKGAPLTEYVMERDGKTESEAIAYLQAKQAKQDTLANLKKSGVTADGAWFQGTQLVVGVGSKSEAAKVRAAGLSTSTTTQSALDNRSDQVLKAVGTKSGLASVGANLQAGVVDVVLTKDASKSLRSKLAAMDGVKVSTGDALTTHADVVPGRIMDLDPGSNCSLGYPGKTADGNNVLLTAGHCVERLPHILDANGTHIGKGTKTRFATGRSSVDMGLMDIDAEDRGVASVDSRGHSGNYDVKGMSKNAVGSEICKAGNTTGWTCGKIQGYNKTVNYGGTVVSGLAQATVCSEGGDSGGAYIGSDNRAQGMTSGGPVGVDCGYNKGASAGSYSFYQPVVDAASYYGVTIDTK